MLAVRPAAETPKQALAGRHPAASVRSVAVEGPEAVAPTRLLRELKLQLLELQLLLCQLRLGCTVPTDSDWLAASLASSLPSAAPWEQPASQQPSEVAQEKRAARLLPRPEVDALRFLDSRNTQPKTATAAETPLEMRSKRQEAAPLAER
jgi:hypothetical protein